MYYSKPSQTPILLYLAQVSMLSKTVSKVACARPIWRRLYANSSNKVGSPESTTESKPKVNRFAKQYADQDRNRNRLQSGSNRTIPRDPNPSNEGPGKNSSNTNRQTSAKQNLEKLKQNRSQQIRCGQKKITRSGSANLGSSANSSSQPRAPLLQSAPRKRIQPKKIKKTVKKLVKIQLPPFITASNLATIMHVPLNDVFKKLEGLGFEDIRHNYILDRENAAMVADEYGIEVEVVEESGDDLFPAPIKPDLLVERPPVVTIMGHVDHGKTTILDYLRKSSIVSQEFGGITQHIGAFSVTTPKSKKRITFLDTPGHAAFLKMRERGAIITDIVILVVAADDSVMPQTIEAIKHAKKSGVPIIVAVNKCDKPGVNVEKVLGDLSLHGVDIEDYGGETQTVQVSGKTGLNMDKLEEAVITLSELCDFKAEPKGIHAEGWIIESEVVKGMGNVATVLVRRGSLKNGDIIVAGKTFCKIRGMKDENNKMVKIAGPSTPVRIWGWKDLPDSGDQILQANSEQIAKKVIDYRITRSQEIQATRDIEDINVKRLEEIKEAERLEKIAELKKAGLDASTLEKAEQDKKTIKCNYIVRSDVFGSAEAIKESIDGLGNEEVESVVISHEAGPPTDSDIELAKTFGATIFCFNMKVPKPIAVRADKEKVKVKEHNIIYRLIEDVTDELSFHLKPRVEIKTLGEVDIKDVFVVTVKKQKVKIAGCKVTTGSIKSSSQVKVLRNGQEVYCGKLSSLKHVKDDITEATKGKDCGIAFEKWQDFEAGDKIQVYEEILHKRYL